VLLAGIGAAAGGIAAACGSSATNGGANDGGSLDGGTFDASAYTQKDTGSSAPKMIMNNAPPGQSTDASADAFWANDPPPMYCGFDGGMEPATPGGTPDCPSDKNRQGCPCPSAGMSAACWPGLRVDRNVGQCKDGMTTCMETNEGTDLQWGPCMGYVLPEPGAEAGAPACKCFSGGQWLINNLSPCFVSGSSSGSGPVYAVSTIQQGDGGAAACPAISGPPPVPAPSQPWSTDSLTVDCPGHYNLCFSLKAGSASSPKSTDCTVMTVCTEADYPTANVTEVIPPLPGWTTTSDTCSTQFNTSGGYGEMTVQGLSELCEKVDNGMGGPMVFNRVQYCPTACDTDPSGAGCMDCMQGGSGSF
jgi:hypothetical protein